MVFPVNWEALTHGPQRVPCPRCRDVTLAASDAFTVSATGLLEHAYYCTKCRWGFQLRYDPQHPRYYICAAYISPGTNGSFGKLAQRKKRRK